MDSSLYTINATATLHILASDEEEATRIAEKLTHNASWELPGELTLSLSAPYKTPNQPQALKNESAEPIRAPLKGKAMDITVKRHVAKIGELTAQVHAQAMTIAGKEAGECLLRAALEDHVIQESEDAHELIALRSRIARLEAVAAEVVAAFNWRIAPNHHNEHLVKHEQLAGLYDRARAALAISELREDIQPLYYVTHPDGSFSVADPQPVIVPK